MNIKYTLIFLFIFIGFSTQAQQTRYLIVLKDKGSNTFTLANPTAYLSARSVARRARYNIPIDSTDLPITARYLDSIKKAGNVEILNVSKWLNQVAIRTTDAAALAKINDFPFVKSSKAIASRVNTNYFPVYKKLDPPQPTEVPGESNRGAEQTGTTALPYGRSNGQVKLHRADWLHDRGFQGQGMQMAVMDAGFYHYKTLPTFDSIRRNGQILGTWDFVAREESVDEDDTHGMQCLSTIGANLPGVFVGTAPKTSFYLYRTEDVASEYPIEEQNWAAASERADSTGVDITSTSLGYYDFDDPSLNYTYANMDGNTTISARAADFAAKKGMMVVIAAGNEGNSAWRYIITPADADSVLSVGAVDTTGRVASFTSYGPSSDGQIKPSVAATGLFAIVANPSTGQPQYANGTSFACPNMAGITTCLWQAFPEINNMGIIDVLQKTGTRATNPDDRIGYGIPDVKKAFVILEQKLVTKQASIVDCNVSLSLSAKTTSDMTIELQRKTAGQAAYTTINTWQGQAPFSIKNYVFQDNLNGQSLGAVQYRFQLKIAGDTTFMLDSLALNYVKSCNPAENTISFGPNPVTNNLTVALVRSTAAKISVSVVNALGQKIYSNQFDQAEGTNNLVIPMQNRSAGMYYLTVMADGEMILNKQIIKR